MSAPEPAHPLFDRMTDGEITRHFDDRDCEPDPPEDYLEAEAELHDRIHRDQEHGGGECDCPAAEPEYTEEPPF